VRQSKGRHQGWRDICQGEMTGTGLEPISAIGKEEDDLEESRRIARRGGWGLGKGVI